jgi:cytochrome c-type biogenesis protein CcmF
LTWLVASGDLSVAYAAEHAAPPGAGLGYRLAAVWAGQAGGLLLWCVETALVALAVRPRTQPRAVAILCGLQACLLGLAAVANPFAPAVAGAAAPGLNPLLQHPMMLIHPPMLFLGYALLAVPFAITLGALAERDPAAWPARVRPWVLVSWLALTAGNGFGAVWAYKTFGWGGYWSWDPVENTSFVPWALAAVTVHALGLAARDRRWLRPAALAALGGFLVVLYGSFLSRSGLLAGASVHAYVEGEPFFVWALGLLLAAGVGLSAVLLLRAGPKWAPAEAGEPPESAATAWGMRLVAGLALVVLAGMSLPMVDLAPQTTAYDTAALPFALGFMLLLAWPKRWQGPGAEAVARVVVIGVFALLLIGAGLGVALGAGAPLGVGVLLAPLLAVACLVVLVRSLGQLLVTRRSLRERGAALAHFGLAALLLAALVSGYLAFSQQEFLPLGGEITAGGHTVKLERLSQPNPAVARADITVAGRPGVLEEEQSPAFAMPLRRAWILKAAWGDLYLTPLKILLAPSEVEGQPVPAGVMLEYTIKPGMRLLWLGMWCLAAGMLGAVVGKRRTAGGGRSPRPTNGNGRSPRPSAWPTLRSGPGSA